MAIFAQFVLLVGSTFGTQTSGRMGIAIYDAATNLPTNGNNCLVNYQQNINGVVTVASTTIPGLSVVVYTGITNDTNPASPFFTQFTILSLVPGAGIPPDPAADDLAITNVLTTPESVSGAKDGTVTINATSSFPAITYSLDNITYQGSNVFTGQASGAGTAYVKDTNAGLKSLPYSVGLVGNILISDPSVNLGNGNISRWNAAFNPIYFKYQRKDFTITSITQDISTGNILVAVNGNMTNVKVRTFIPPTVSGQPSILSPGDLVYIQTANYFGSYEVLSKTTGTLVLVCPYVANDGVGYININSLRPYYKIQTTVTFVDPVTGLFNTITSNNYPFPNGICNVDLSSFLKSLLQIKDLSNYTQTNYRDMQLSASYTVKYAEVWSGNAPTWVSIAQPYYVTYTARQLQQIGGGNMQEFVPYPLGYQPAKWVTDFINPVYNPAFPFDLGFIFSEYMVNLSCFYVITLLDINMVPLVNQSVNNTFILNENGSFILNQDGSKFIIASQALVSTPIVQHVGLNRLLINFVPPATCWYFTVQLKYTTTPVSGTPATFPLTKAITCRVDQNTPDRQVYLRWLGLTGSWNYYTFAYNQVKTLEVSNQVNIKNFITDWAGSDTIQDVISKNAGKKIQVFAENISTDDIHGLEPIKYSPKVQMYVGAGPVWQTIDTGSGSYTEEETMLDQYSFSITFALPEINIQTQ